MNVYLDLRKATYTFVDVGGRPRAVTCRAASRAAEREARHVRVTRGLEHKWACGGAPRGRALRSNVKMWRKTAESCPLHSEKHAF